MATLAAIFMVSLFGSLHCAGMCGALVAFAVGTPGTQSTGSLAMLQTAYHGGRLVTYAAIGAVCGMLGAALDLAGSLVGLSRVAAVLAGVMMVGVGVAAILRYRGIRLPKLKLPGHLHRAVVMGQRAAMGLRPFPRALTIGLLTGFLPCGWLYAFAVIAAGAGSAVWGIAIMVSFWMGTVPILVSLGVGVQALTGVVGRRIPLITAVLLVLLGLHTIAGRMTLPVSAFETSVTLDREADVTEQAEQLLKITPPCCEDHAP